MRVDGRVALISGGADGLGAAAARRLVAAGASVMLGDIDLARAEATAASLGDKAAAIALDVRERSQWDAAVAATVARFGSLSILVNNAGISEPGNIEDATEDNWDRTLAINLTGPFHGCRAALPAMVTRGGPGSIVNISSMLGLRPGAMYLAYCASKAGVTMLTKSVALHCAAKKYPIRCNSVHPGAIATPMYERYLDSGIMPRADMEAMFAAAHPMGRVGQPEEIAEAVLFLASEASSFTTGTELTVDGGGYFRE